VSAEDEVVAEGAALVLVDDDGGAALPAGTETATVVGGAEVFEPPQPASVKQHTATTALRRNIALRT
jgi:hypothetical protein